MSKYCDNARCDLFVFFYLFVCFRDTALEAATNMAEQAINDNRNILPDVNLHMIKMNGGCNSETVMRTFLNYYLRPVRVLGVLGPPCSEDVEPIAGKSISTFNLLRFVYSALARFHILNAPLRNSISFEKQKYKL